jgi:hypothetical protein
MAITVQSGDILQAQRDLAVFATFSPTPAGFREGDGVRHSEAEWRQA